MFLAKLDFGLIVLVGGAFGYLRCKNKRQDLLLLFEIVIPFLLMFFGPLLVLVFVAVGTIEIAPLVQKLHVIENIPDLISKSMILIVAYIFGGWSGLIGGTSPTNSQFPNLSNDRRNS